MRPPDSASTFFAQGAMKFFGTGAARRQELVNAERDLLRGAADDPAASASARPEPLRGG